MSTRSWLTIAVLLLVQPLSAFAAEGASPNPAWNVARAQFTTGIRDREPVDRLVVASPLVHEVYFFTDLRNLQGRTVTHRWEYQGTVVSQKPFRVDGPRWRVYSKFEIEPEQVGRWSVTVVDESGWPLYTELFRYENGAPLLQPLVAPNAVGTGSGVVGQQPATAAAVLPSDTDVAPVGASPAPTVVPTADTINRSE